MQLTRRGKVVARIVPAPRTKPHKFKVRDFGAIQRGIFGDDLKSRMLSPEDSAFIRDRGER